MDLSEITYNKNRHPWELARAHCILKVLNEYSIIGDILDVGCGDGFFDLYLSRTNQNIKTICGVDTGLSNDYRIDNVYFVDSIENAPDQLFDAILLMDVLEHIEHDVEFLSSIKNRLKPKGKLLITVPALQKLFSVHDIKLRHIRRYEYEQLKTLLMKTGYKVTLCSFFFFILVIIRLLSKNVPQELGQWNYSEKNIVTRITVFILSCDYSICLFLARIGIRIKGLSLLCVAEQ